MKREALGCLPTASVHVLLKQTNVMMYVKIKLHLLISIVIVAECGNTKFGREVGSLKNEQFKIARRGARGEVFENLFVIYDASFLSLVWPKITNGVHLLIEQPCWDDISVFYRHYTEGRAWAYKALDASGRYRSSLFNGDRFWLGSKDQCLRLDRDFTGRARNETYEDLQNSDYVNAVFRREKYFDHATNGWRWMVHNEELVRRTVAADNQPPFSLAYTTVHATLNITKLTIAKSYDITLGVCLPRTCSTDDIKSIINFSIMISDNLKSNKTTPRLVKITSLRSIEDSYDIKDDIGAISLIAITTLLLLLAVVATVIELDWKCIPYNPNKMSFDLQTFSEEDRSTYEKKKYIEAMQNFEDLDKLAKMEQIAMTLKSKVPPMSLSMDRQTSCKRCGKYKKQYQAPIPGTSLTSPRLIYNNSSTAILVTDERKHSLICRLFLCFSIKYCWNRIFNKDTSNKDLALVHALKIFATLWVIYVHVALMANYLSDKAENLNDRGGAYYTITTGTTAFDILLFVSGLFSSHHFFYLKSRYSVEELVSFRGVCGQVMQFVCFVTNRIIRLLPSYAYAVLVSGVVAREWRATAALTLPDADHEACVQNWWRNLLYITTLYPEHEQCMQVSWYLSTETQLHVVGALLCLCAARARLVATVAVTTALAATAIDLVGAHLHYGNTFRDVFELYWTVVDRPWARVTPYLVGVFAGWLVHKSRGNINISNSTSCLLWLSSSLLLLASVAAPLAPTAWFAACAHVTWPLALLWPVVLASTNYSGWCGGVHGRSSAAMSRLCAGAVLLHAPLARMLLLSADSALCSHSACIWMYFTGTAVVTFVSSLVLALLLEMPCCSLLRRLSDCAS